MKLPYQAALPGGLRSLPLRGAWIEIPKPEEAAQNASVAPLAGAWSVIAADELFVQLRKVFL